MPLHSRHIKNTLECAKDDFRVVQGSESGLLVGPHQSLLLCSLPVLGHMTWWQMQEQCFPHPSFLSQTICSSALR